MLLFCNQRNQLERAEMAQMARQKTGLKGPEFNPQRKQENFTCFLLVALGPMRSTSNYLLPCYKFM